jgi:hypothetical protein
MSGSSSGSSTDAVRKACARIEDLLGASEAFRKVDDRFYIVRQGSAYIYIHVLPWERRPFARHTHGDGAHAAAHAMHKDEPRAMVRFVSQLARGVDITPDLALRLLQLNARLRIGAFGWVGDGRCVTLQHTLPIGHTLDDSDLLATLGDLAMLADEYDDRVVDEAGGQTMQSLLETREVALLEQELGLDSARHLPAAPRVEPKAGRTPSRPPPKR